MKFEKLKFLEKLSPHKMLHKREFINPQRDWYRGFTVAGALFIIGISYIAYDFYVQFISSPETPIVSTEIASYPKNDVVYFSEMYAERERTLERLRNEQLQMRTIEDVLAEEIENEEEETLAQ